MFFLISQTTQTANLFAKAAAGQEVIISTLDDVVDDIVYGQYLPAHCLTCIEVVGNAKLSSTFLKKLVPKSRVVVYSTSYDANHFIYYWELGATYIASEVIATELAKLFSIPITAEVRGKQRNIEIDTTNGCVKIRDVIILLTVTEVRLLNALLAAGGSYLTRQQLLDAIGQNTEHDERLIDSHLRRLRSKLKKFGFSPNIIVTGYGFGYRIDFAKIDEVDKTTDLRIEREWRGS